MAYIKNKDKLIERIEKVLESFGDKQMQITVTFDVFPSSYEDSIVNIRVKTEEVE